MEAVWEGDSGMYHLTSLSLGEGSRLENGIPMMVINIDIYVCFCMRKYETKIKMVAISRDETVG